MAEPAGDARKKQGAYYTPDEVVSSLTRWAVSRESDRLLDPSCGDGRFIAAHRRSVGIEQDPAAAAQAIQRAPAALVHEGEFFEWASHTRERFECACGNPPFIRYQRFNGTVREHALRLCRRLGAQFSALTSSWAPFVVAAASLLKPGGRMAFVVPAEIGHAPYAAPLLEYLIAHFAVVHVIAVRERIFAGLSEDCWLLYTEGFGGVSKEVRFSALPSFRHMAAPPAGFECVRVDTWRSVWNRRLRAFLMPAAARQVYTEVASQEASTRLGRIAKVGIGYVTGANDFFHLRPSAARQLRIPSSVLHPSVRNGRVLPARRLTRSLVERWQRSDEPMMLLRLAKAGTLNKAIRRYLDSEAGQLARESYKCRNRDPWYAVPDIQVPDYFLTYMSGRNVALVRNDARCVGTNSVHTVRATDPAALKRLTGAWDSPFVRLSCEIEGHPLGGGLLKLEPGEANQILLPSHQNWPHLPAAILEQAVETLREWRHCSPVPEKLP